MFIDETKISVKAGRGGDGSVSFRHEKYVPMGGPDGGDGGNGGDVILVASDQASDLSDFNRLRKFNAEDGHNGMGQKMHGKNGEDLTLAVPIGTQIFDHEGVLIADLTSEGDPYIPAKGGNGGWGNIHFASSIKQAPKWSKKGLPGESVDLSLELKMIANVGLIGLPNAGKSTLLSVISNARPKIANYPFTTLEPNLGVIKGIDKNIIVADIPGLIEGASTGKGLGDKFLKHIERTTILVHVIDINSEDILRDYEVIRKELVAFSGKLAKKKEIVVLSKADTIDDNGIKKIEKKLKKLNPIVISGSSHLGVDELLKRILKELKQEEYA